MQALSSIMGNCFGSETTDSDNIPFLSEDQSVDTQDLHTPPPYRHTNQVSNFFCKFAAVHSNFGFIKVLHAEKFVICQYTFHANYILSFKAISTVKAKLA